MSPAHRRARAALKAAERMHAKHKHLGGMAAQLALHALELCRADLAHFESAK